MPRLPIWCALPTSMPLICILDCATPVLRLIFRFARANARTKSTKSKLRNAQSSPRPTIIVLSPLPPPGGTGSAAGVVTNALVDDTTSAANGEGVGTGEGKGDAVSTSVVCKDGGGLIFVVLIGSGEGTSLEGNGLEVPR